jgi:hypothetical protein
VVERHFEFWTSLIDDPRGLRAFLSMRTQVLKRRVR